MQAPSRRLRALALTLTLALASFTVAGPSPALAQETAAQKTRADFPDRRWTPVTAADGGLVGSGLATDPSSSAYANPALWLTAQWSLRISGAMVNPNRDDLRGSTVEFQEANGFPMLGEAALRFQWRGLGFGAYFAQPHYEHGETRFIGFDPDFPSAGGDPYPRTNTFTSATRYAGAGVAIRLKGGAVVGVGPEVVLTKEHYASIPDVPPAMFADTLVTERDFTSFGGVAGAIVPIGGTWTIGGSFRLAGDGDDGEATDQPPQVGLLGVRWGRTAGSAAHAGLRFLGSRTVDLADSNSTGPVEAESRLEMSAGYAYVDPAGTWTIRAGAALSPRPNDAANRLTRFGLSVGVGGEGLRGALAYQRESESRASGRNSSRNLVIGTFELTR